MTFVFFSPGSSLIKTTDMVRRSSPVSPAASTYGLIHSGQYCYKVLVLQSNPRNSGSFPNSRPRTVSDPDQVQQRGRPPLLLFQGPRYQRLVFAQRRAPRNLRRPQWNRLDDRCRLYVTSSSQFVLHEHNKPSAPAQSRFLMSGSADNTLRLWSVQSGKCLYKWEFPTAVKSVAFNDNDDQVVCITEQRMGYQGAVRVFNINRDGDGTKRLSPN